MASQVFLIIGAFLTLLGGISGGIGGSNLFWSKARKKYVEAVANSPRGQSAEKRREEAAPYKMQLVKKEQFRDKFTLIAWGLVIVGSISSLIGAFMA